MKIAGGGTYGCCREGSCDDVLHHLCRDPCRLFHVLHITKLVTARGKSKINGIFSAERLIVAGVWDGMGMTGDGCIPDMMES